MLFDNTLLAITERREGNAAVFKTATYIRWWALAALKLADALAPLKIR